MPPDQLRHPTLVVVRGNSGAGKTSAAREVRRRYGRGCALLEQDHLRRVVLREHDNDGIGVVAPVFIMATVRSALELGYHVVLEGILHTGRYGDILGRLIKEHLGPTHVYYLDVSFDESVRRHQRRPEPVPVTPEQMRAWYTPRDLLRVPGEAIIPESSTPDDTVTTILHTSGLAHTRPRTPCPVHCPDCAANPDI